MQHVFTSFVCCAQYFLLKHAMQKVLFHRSAFACAPQRFPMNTGDESTNAAYKNRSTSPSNDQLYPEELP
jgi:hypothetical protein